MFERLLYQIGNWRAHWRALWIGTATYFADKSGEVVVMRGVLRAKVTRSNPKWWQRRTVDLGVVGRRVVTTAGVNYMRDAFNAGTAINLFNFHDSGTGAGAEAIGDTALGTPTGIARVAGTKDTTVAKIYETEAVITYNAGFAVTEHGLFSAASAGTLWDRTVFAAINVVNTNTITFTYLLTINDGG